MIKHYSITIALIVITILSVMLADYLEFYQILPPDGAFVLKEFTTFFARLSICLLSVYVFLRHVILKYLCGSDDCVAEFCNIWQTGVEKSHRVIIVIVSFLVLFLGSTLLMLA